MGKTIIDLTGQRFGRLLVVERAKNYVYPDGKKISVKWICQCDCGNITEVRSSHLKNSSIISCGCYRIEKIKDSNFNDITGKVFGRLTVISLAYINNKLGAFWNCSCLCGEEKVIKAGSLLSGNTTSCGCYFREMISETKTSNIIGHKFGKLEVVSLYKRKNLHGGSILYWLCNCECGGSVITSTASLQSGKCKSCGCLRESFIATRVKEWCKTTFEYTDLEHKMFINPETNRWLRCDIYLGEKSSTNGIYIEVNGKQHYEFNNRYHKSKEDFEYNKNLDKIKKQYAKKHGQYIEIDLRKIKNIEAAINHIIKIIEAI